MKKILVFLLVASMTNSVAAQVSGNINYRDQESGNINYNNQSRLNSNNIEVPPPVNSDLLISVKGLANVKADSYVAIFSVTQSGNTTVEVSNLIDKRINEALAPFKTKAGVKTYVDMISFVPTYEYEVDKKVFSKSTYNEVPSGFELKKISI